MIRDSQAEVVGTASDQCLTPSGFTSVDSSGFSLMADLKPRIPSPIPLPNSGSFLGPNTSRAIPKITSRCIGWNNPSSITPPQIGDALDTDKKQRRQENQAPRPAVSLQSRRPASDPGQLRLTIKHCSGLSPHPLPDRAGTQKTLPM